MSLEKLTLNISVHDLVDFLLRRGDIDDRIYNDETMSMGSKIHSSYQKKQKGYLSEYPLSCSLKRPLGTIFLQGRADGIIDGDTPLIDEIKSTVDDLDHFHDEQKDWHLGQAICYAYMFCLEKHKENTRIRLTYISQVSDEKKVFEYDFTFDDLEKRITSYCDDYLSFMAKRFSHQKEVEESASSLAFPYSSWRKGQRDFAKYVFGTAKKGGCFFAEAPTGIGKTMSSLFPAIKSYKPKRIDKIFYLTAKTTGGLMAYSSFGELIEKGFKGIDSFLVAKDKICFSRGKRCNPDECKFAKGYYSKIKDALEEGISSGRRFDYLYVDELARKYSICPFELQLDLSLFADLVIGDYNYFLDPMVKLERYFGETADPSTSLVLLDEAHNLIERARDCYSASLSTRLIRFAKKECDGAKGDSLKRALTKVHNALISSFPNDEDGFKELDEIPLSIIKAIDSLRNANKKARKEKGYKTGENFKSVFRDAIRFFRISEEFYGNGYRLYAFKKDKEFGIKLFCIDPSMFILESFKSVRGVVSFSATLSPISYFISSLLGEKEEAPYLLLPSPFPKENIKILVAPFVSVRYKDREKTLPEVASYLNELVGAKKGNYFLYFPSYEYLEKIRPHLDFEDASIFVQDRNMSNEEREDFLLNFPQKPKFTNVGLLVLGGPFSEGIDLPSDRLIGVGIVGIGLPQVSFENDLIRDYFSSKEEDGFAYAYKNPGMNKVMQAIGRLIRNETDVGAALLIDDRYASDEYRGPLLRKYHDYEIITEPKEARTALKEFWDNKNPYENS